MSTIIQQGRFTSDGTAKTLAIRSDVDFMYVYNWTVLSAAGADTGAQFYWQRGMSQDTGVIYLKTTTTDALQIDNMASGGFTLIDSSDQSPGPLTALTSISNAQPPLVTVTSTAGLVDGDVVRIIDTTSGQQLGGIDFTIDVVNSTTFQLEYMSAIATTTGGFYRKIDFDPIFYPRRRFMSKVLSSGSSTIVTMTVTHGYTVGQAVRFTVPAAYGMVELDGLVGNITAIGDADTDGDTNTITVDIDSSAFTAFAFPLTAAVPFSPALVVPFGEDTAVALNNNVGILDDATRNTAFLGMRLAAGTTSPAGATSDLIYWVAGRSFSVNNE